MPIRPRFSVLLWLGSVSLLLSGVVAGLALRQPTATAPANPLGATPLPPVIWRVYMHDHAEAERLNSGGWDLVEGHGPGYLLVVGDDTTDEALRAAGFTVTLDQRPTLPGSPETFYGGYHTVVEHNQHLNTVATTHPELAQVVDYGDSWRKVNDLGGNDLLALCITQQQAGSCALQPETTKPRFFFMAAIHARELTTSEMLWRWIDYLVNGYGADPEATALLNYAEIWVVPVINPDGRQIVEAGGNSPYYQRKNANNTLPPPTPQPVCSNPPTSSNQYGIDLNRNANFAWGGPGASTFACDQTFRGASAASEPEEYYLETLLAQLFRDQRPDDRVTSAPITTTGLLLTLHSYSDLVILPWGDTTTHAPNETGLRSLAFRMSYYNGYETGQGPEILYAVSGATDDWAYGHLGVPGFTFEIGPSGGGCSGFLPAYSCQDSTFWPLNFPAFLYAAKSARQPYATGLGPTVITTTQSALTVTAGTLVTLTALLNDNAYGNVGVGRPAAQNVAAATYFVDTPPWAGEGFAMVAQDGAFNSASETAIATLNTTALAPGRHLIFFTGQDASGNNGLYAVRFLFVQGNAAPTLTPLGAQTTLEDTPLGPLFFTVSDPDNQPLMLTATSGDVALVPSANLALGGAGLTRTLTLTPALNAFGSTVITLTVTDGLSTTRAPFTLTVTPQNDAPTINALSDYTLTLPATTLTTTFTISDVDTPLAALTVTLTADDATLVPATGLSLNGSGAAWTATLTPTRHWLGASFLTLTVSDGDLTTQHRIRLTVQGYWGFGALMVKP